MAVESLGIKDLSSHAKETAIHNMINYFNANGSTYSFKYDCEYMEFLAMIGKLKFTASGEILS